MKCNIPAGDLNQRLNGTICRYRGVPVRVICEGGSTLSLWGISEGQHVANIKADDAEFDISGIPLGFVQVSPTTVVYVSRKAARIWKQGVTMESLSFKYLSRPSELEPRFNILSKAFEDSVMDRFPSLQEAKEQLRVVPKDDRPTVDVAISRDVALSYVREMELTHVFYKEEKVGFMIKQDNTVITPSRDYGWVISKNLSFFDWKVE